jgi:hypothetical protein
VWAPFQFLVGTWEGTGQGRPGSSHVRRQYQFVLNGKFLQVKNRSVYDPHDKNPSGEVHEDWGFLSFDETRGVFVLRQFHVEGFVNQYALLGPASGDLPLRFVSEAIENIAPGWRARETYRKLGDNEFIETFDLAEPGKEFELYTENHFHRSNDLRETHSAA